MQRSLLCRNAVKYSMWRVEHAITMRTRFLDRGLATVWAALAICFLPVPARAERPRPVRIYDVGRDVPATKLLKRVEPDLPNAARTRKRVQPRWFFALTIDENGNVADLKLIKANNSSLTPYVKAAVYKWKY